MLIAYKFYLFTLFPPKQNNMRFRYVHHVVLPPLTLLNTNLPPLLLGHESVLRHKLQQLGRYLHMPEDIVVGLVPVRVAYFLRERGYVGLIGHGLNKNEPVVL